MNAIIEFDPGNKTNPKRLKWVVREDAGILARFLFRDDAELFARVIQRTRP